MTTTPAPIDFWLDLLSLPASLASRRADGIVFDRTGRLGAASDQPDALRDAPFDAGLESGRKEWEFALLFVRTFRSLDPIVGDDASARQWLHSGNRALNARPIDLIGQTEGLVRVVHDLDASRGRV